MIANLSNDEQHKHPYGGGWVANTARVDDTVYVGPFAMVYGHAELTGRVRVEDYAQVSGYAKLSGDVRVARNVWVEKGALHTGVFVRNERVATKQERIR